MGRGLNPICWAAGEDRIFKMAAVAWSKSHLSFSPGPGWPALAAYSLLSLLSLCSMKRAGRPF